jgi:N-acetylmuramic acid 6-phosphate etherase
MQSAESTPPLFLGIEGGATRTVAILADGQGRQLHRIEAGPANLRLLTDEQLSRHLAELAAQMPAPAGLCIGLAGVRAPSDRKRVLDAAAKAWPGTPCRACADLETALAAFEPRSAKPAAAQVLVLSGTGSCCYGQAGDGRTAKVGGWGHLLGDKGSGYEMGLRALKAVVFAYDRDGKWPRLGERILRALHLNEPENLVGWVQKAEKKAVAALAIEVFEAWVEGDEIAEHIIAAAASTLAHDAAICAGRLVRRRARVQFVLSGSVLLKQPQFAKLVARQIRRHWPMSDSAPLKNESAWGAVRLARREWELVSARSNGAVSSTAPTTATRQPTTPTPQTQFYIPEALGLSPTEQRNPRSQKLHKLTVPDAITLMLEEEAQVPGILLQHRATIAQCVRAVARAFRGGGRLFYVGAGTSGRLGTLDASECPPTFRAPAEQVQGIMAGGQEALWLSIEGAEDDAHAGAAAVKFRGVRQGDVVIGIAASGRTPFVWGALQAAKELGARTILVCFNPHIKIARQHKPDIVLAPNLGPEVLTGSTRLKAGTATKLIANLMTTLSMVQMGKVVSNLMVDLNPSNVKLRDRAIRIVRDLTGAEADEARFALEESDWVIKEALRRLHWKPKQAAV